MKKSLVLFLLMLVNIGVYAQSDTFKVKDDSFHKIEGCITIPARYDDNDYPMALLKIIPENIDEQDRAKLYFEGNLATFIEVEQNIGETWVYLTAEAATFLRIKHPDFGATEFWFPMSLKPKQCYEMVLQNVPIVPANNSAFIVFESDPPGADIYIDGEHYGQTPKVISELHVGEHLIMIEKEGYTPISKNIMIKGGETLTLSETLKKKSLVSDTIQKEDVVKLKPINGEKVVSSSSEKNRSSERMKCFLLNVAYSVAPQMSYGLTYGQVKRFGWFVSAMTNFQFRFKGNDATVGIVSLTGKDSSSRLSLIGGIAVRVSGPVYAKIGTGYGMRVKCWETDEAKWYVYEPDTYKGIDLSAGLMINAKGCVISLDAVTTSFKTLEIKMGIGIGWN